VTNRGRRVSDVIVGLTVGAGILGYAWAVLPYRYFFVVCLYLAYEGWTLINRYAQDTLSESVWRLSKRPLVPWLFGVAYGWALASGVITDVYLASALAFLQGHFFFQSYGGVVRDQAP
jgi:hypothetical protein